MTLPCLLVAYDGDNGIFPSDEELIARSLATRELTRAQVPGDHYGFPPRAGRERGDGRRWLRTLAEGADPAALVVARPVELRARRSRQTAADPDPPAAAAHPRGPARVKARVVVQNSTRMPLGSVA